MISKDEGLKSIKRFLAKYGIEAEPENAIATLHLMHAHGMDQNAALDQSSRCANDHGVDAWFYNEQKRELVIYQSKLTESRPAALRGFGDLDSARQWLEQVLIDGSLSEVPNSNPCLYNLFCKLSKERESILKVSFRLLSLFEESELEDSPEVDDFHKALVKSALNGFVKKRDGKLASQLCQYNLEAAIPEKIKTYPIARIPEAQIDLRNTAHLDLAYIPLYSLVELYRQRGDVLFDKNVRLSLMWTKEAKERLVNPLTETLDRITAGQLSPSIFPFYHIGVTIAASSSQRESAGQLNLEAPSIINGCQTINIANEYFKRLERAKDEDAIARFKQVKVVAKVVVGTTNDELKEITNANNRQNPIENWQLFSNEPIHIEIEQSLKDAGIFYERQKGKFDTVMKNTDNVKHYFNTNGTYIKVTDLGQVIALSRRMLQAAAKPSELFVHKENHDKFFDRAVPRHPRDIVYCINVQKAARRGLGVYLDQPSYANSNAQKIFVKPIVKAYLYRLALLYFYQNPNRDIARAEYSTTLTKKASSTLVAEMQKFYIKVISKIKGWYTDASKGLSIEVSKKSMDAFFDGLEIELGIDPEGPVPFSGRSIDWNKYSEES